MEEPILNKVAQSGLISIDLEDWYPQGKCVEIDLADWLEGGFILKEKDFRAKIEEHNWQQYQDQYVAINCSTDAIVPSWAYLLMSLRLQPYAVKVIHGDLNLLEILIFEEVIAKIDIKPYQNQRVIVKGCSKRFIPDNAYIQLVNRLQPVVKSLFFGEACSSVPLYKAKL